MDSILSPEEYASISLSNVKYLNCAQMAEYFYYKYLDRMNPSMINTYQDDMWGGEADYPFAVDTFLQMALPWFDNVKIEKEDLDAMETYVRSGWDPDLKERTLGWIAQHRKSAGELS